MADTITTAGTITTSTMTMADTTEDTEEITAMDTTVTITPMKCIKVDGSECVLLCS